MYLVNMILKFKLSVYEVAEAVREKKKKYGNWKKEKSSEASKECVAHTGYIPGAAAPGSKS